MSGLLDVPIDSMVAARQSDAAFRTSASLERLDGSVLKGDLLEINVAGKRIRMHPAEGGADITLPFGEVRALHMTVAVDDTDPRGGDHDTIPFQLNYHDGAKLARRARDVRIDAESFQFIAANGFGGLTRTFVPFAVLLGYKIGANGGAATNGLAPERPRPAAAKGAPPLETKEEVSEILTSGVLPRWQPSTARAVQGNVSKSTPDPAALADRLGMPYVNLRDFDIDPMVLPQLPESLLREHMVIPMYIHDGHLVVAMQDPADAELVRLMGFVTGRQIEVCVAAHDDIAEAIEHHYGLHESSSTLQELERDAQIGLAEVRSDEDVERMSMEKPIVRLVNNILVDAIRRNVSDIHIRPAEDHFELIYRMDGTLVQIRKLPKVLLQAVVARIKILGRMNIAERRLPQDGRTRMIEHDAVVDMRISVIPTVDGESVVIRLLNAGTGLRTISELGFNKSDADTFTDLLHKSYGMILVTGPTGSGKSTTLYAALQEIIRQNVNIITIEDPVEYHIGGIEQIQVNTVPGYTFARALRNILRHDPDVIMVGEIRDMETAKTAVESALTGHLVLSTLHTNDAPTTVTRLIEMGVEPFLVRTSLLGVLAQRLVRLNCRQCMVEEPVDTLMRAALGVGNEEKFYRGSGCDACHNTGFKGRKAVYELLPMTATVRATVDAGVSADVIREQAMKEGMVSLTENALTLARDRLISLAEAYRVRLE